MSERDSEVYAQRMREVNARAKAAEAALTHLEEHGCNAYHPEGTREWQEQCDEPGCTAEATTGWPTRPGGTGPNGGYRRTCGDHWQRSWQAQEERET